MEAVANSTWQPLCAEEPMHPGRRWWRQGRERWGGGGGRGGGEGRRGRWKEGKEARGRIVGRSRRRCALWSPSPPPHTRVCSPSWGGINMLFGLSDIFVDFSEKGENLKVYWVQGLRPSILAVTSTWKLDSATIRIFWFFAPFLPVCDFVLFPKSNSTWSGCIWMLRQSSWKIRWLI